MRSRAALLADWDRPIGVSTTDLLTFTGVALLLVTVALLACYIPARRAMKVDLAASLRHE